MIFYTGIWMRGKEGRQTVQEVTESMHFTKLWVKNLTLLHQSEQLIFHIEETTIST